jgi:hypothetical protein
LKTPSNDPESFSLRTCLPHGTATTPAATKPDATERGQPDLLTVTDERNEIPVCPTRPYMPVGRVTYLVMVVG